MACEHHWEGTMFAPGDIVNLSPKGLAAGRGRRVDPYGFRQGVVQRVQKSGKILVVWDGLNAGAAYCADHLTAAVDDKARLRARIADFGTHAAYAKHMGVSQPTISGMLGWKQKPIPEDYKRDIFFGGH